MKRPTYQLKEKVQIDNNLEFPAGTTVQPIEEYNVPEHLKDKLAEANKYNLGKTKYVMCIIGTGWYPVKWESIREVR